MSINRCLNCKIGTSFCVYTKTIDVISQYGKVYKDAPTDNCILGKTDEYAIFPDTEDSKYYPGDIPLLNARNCEADDIQGTDPFISNRYLYESITNNITTGDTFHILESISTHVQRYSVLEKKTVDVIAKNKVNKRYDYDHPLYHIIDYNVPLNTSGVVGLDEKCFVMGTNDISLESKNWAKDDFGEAKKSIGIPKIRQCFGLYGSYDKTTDLILHKSMKDNTRSIPSFKNFTNVKVNQYQDCSYNIFIDDFKLIDDHINNIGLTNDIKVKLYEAYALIKKNNYINLYSLLLNNGVEQQDVFKVLNTISIKNPKLVYKNNQGHRYNIKKISTLYFNVVNDIIDAGMHKELILANIINYVLNDNTLLNHIVGLTPKKLEYMLWFDMIKSELDNKLIDELRPERIKFNEYNSDNEASSLISIITHAIFKQKLLVSSDLPEDFKLVFKRYNNYIDNYIEAKDVESIGAATVNIKDLLIINDHSIYDEFVILVTNVTTISPNEIIDLWSSYENAYITNQPQLFWDYVTSLVDEYNNVGFKLLEVKIDNDTLDIYDFTHSHSTYIRSKNKRYYNIANQEKEHIKLYNDEEDLSHQYNEYNEFEEM